MALTPDFDPAQVVAWIERTGIAGAVVFWWLWKGEKKRADETTDKLLTIIPQAITAIERSTSAMNLLRVAIGGRKFDGDDPPPARSSS